MTVQDRDLMMGLEAVKQKEPALTSAVNMQQELLETLRQAPPPVGVYPDPDLVRAALDKGIPILQVMRPELDWEQFTAQYRQVCRIGARYRPDLSEVFTALEGQLDEQPETVRSAVSAALSVPTVHDAVRRAEADELQSFVLLHALRPFLQALAGQVLPILDDAPWQQGYCPVCAGLPDLAYLEDGTRSRRLVCGRCDTTWNFPRVKCPYCGTANPADLAYYPGPEEKYRLYVCHHCHRYLKALDTTYAGTKIFLPVERTLTLPMDLAAQEEGYH